MSSPRRLHARQALAIVCACAAPRLAALWSAGEPFESDYLRLARSLSSAWRFVDGGVATTFYEPAYPVFLAAALAATGSADAALVAQIALTCGAACAVFALAQRLTGRRRPAWIATLAYACFPYYVRQAATFSGAAFWSAVLPIALWTFVAPPRPLHAARAGVASAILVLSRFSYAPIAAAELLLLSRRGVRQGVAFACGLSLVLPWMYRTYRVDGGLTPPRSGLNLYLSTCEYADWAGRYDFDPLFPHLFARLGKELGHVPPERGARAADDRLRAAALTCAAERPAATVWRKLRNGAMAFSPLLLPVHPRGGSGHAVDTGSRYELREMEDRPWRHTIPHAGATSLLLAGFALGLWYRRDGLENDGILLITTAVFVATAALFLPTTRLLSPMYAVWMIYAGHGVDRWIERRTA